MKLHTLSSTRYQGRRTRSFLLVCIIASLASHTPAAVPAAFPMAATLSSADIQIRVQAGAHSPTLTRLSGASGNVWLNQEIEAPPQHVYRGNTLLPVSWSFRPDLSTSDAHHVEFVYESATPHLQLRWQWRVRSRFGPIEHTIKITNLSQQELWLPLVDSLRLDWHLQPDAHIESLYIEKGADAPSEQGTHLDTVAEGYRWIGRSITYAHPMKGQAREIIPAVIVYQSTGHTARATTYDADCYRILPRWL